MSVGHDIVDVLYKDHIGVKIVEVLDQRAVSAGAEEQLAVLSVGSSVGRDSYCVSAWFLFAVADIEPYAIFVSEMSGGFLDFHSHKGQVVFGNCEMHAYISSFFGSICRAFGQMFLKGGARCAGHFVELNQGFGEVPVVQAALVDQRACYVFVSFLPYEGVYAQPVVR